MADKFFKMRLCADVVMSRGGNDDDEEALPAFQSDVELWQNPIPGSLDCMHFKVQKAASQDS